MSRGAIIVLISDPIEGSVTATIEDVSVAVACPTQTFTSRLLPPFNDDVMERVHETNRKLKSKDVALGEYFDLLNG